MQQLGVQFSDCKPGFPGDEQNKPGESREGKKYPFS